MTSEARPDSPEAGVAHRVAGVTCWFAGEYREARDHLERALALFQPGRDDDLAFRFGQDPGVAAMAYLALALWPLGEVDRATSHSSTGMQRAESPASPMSARSRLDDCITAFFALMRGDPLRAQRKRLELARLAREHDLPMFRASACFSRVGRAARTARAAAGSRTCAAASSCLREQNVLIFDGLLKDCRWPRPKPRRAIRPRHRHPRRSAGDGRSHRHRCFEAELHRARGEILLKRDPANPALRRRSFPDRHRRREAAGHAQLRTARGAFACQTLSIDRPPRRSPRRPRARARRLFADARNARDR